MSGLRTIAAAALMSAFGLAHAAYLAKRHQVPGCAVAANIAKALAGSAAVVAQ